MPFNSTLTAGQLAAIRGGSYASAQYLSLCPNEIIFAALVDQFSFGTAYATVTYNTVTIGAYTDLKVGMTVLISSTPDYRNAEFVGRIRDGNSTAAFITVNETSVGIAPGYFITILNDYRIFDRLARDVSTVQYKDYAYGFFGFAPVISGLQSGYADWIDPSTGGYTIAFNAVATPALQGATIASYQWTTSATLVAGSATTVNPTYRFSPGFTWVTFRATQNDGVYTDFRIPVWAHDRDSFPPALGFTGASITCDERGYNASVAAFEGVETVLDNTLCVIWGDETYNGVPGSLNGTVQFVGRIQNEAVKTDGDDEYSTLPQDVRWELEGIGTQLARTTAPILTIINTAAAATAWDYVQNLTIWRAIVHVLQLHSTLNTVVSLAFEDTTNTYLADVLDTQGQSQFECANDLADAINAGLDFAPSGEIRIGRDARMLPFADRATTPTLANFGLQDMLSFTVEHPHVPPVGRVNAAGGCYDTSADLVTPVLSVAPGEAQRRGQGEAGLQRQILTANMPLATAQEEINERAGHYLALLNSGYTLNVTFPDGYHWLVPRRDVWYEWTIPADSNNRDIEFPVGITWLHTSISHTHNNETGTKQVSANFTIETSGIPGLSFIPPATGETQPYVPYVAPAPTYTLFPETPGTIYPGGTISTAPPLTSPYPPSTGGSSTVGLRDGNIVVVGTASRMWRANRYKIVDEQPWVEITPPLTAGYSIRDVKWSRFDQRLYVLASNTATDQSIVWRCANGLAGSPVWTAGAAFGGDYRVLKTGHLAGGLYAYMPIDNGTLDVVTIPATTDVPGVNTGVFISIGDSVSITATGLVNWGGGAPDNDPNGSTGNFSPSAIMPLQPLAKLVGQVTTGGTFFSVGASAGFVAGSAGTLYLLVNDAPGGYGNNTGQFEATITITPALGEAEVRYSSDHGATFGAALVPGLAAGTYGGFDANKISVGSLAGTAGQATLATTAGGTYAAYGAAMPASTNPNAIWIPRYQFNSISANNSTLTPQYLVSSAALSAGNAALWRVTASGATFTDITPSNGGNFGLAISPNCITMPLKSGARIASILVYAGTKRLQVSTNGGTAWTDRGALTANADCIRYREGDASLQELYYVNQYPFYSPNHGATLSARTRPGSSNLTFIEVFG